MPKQTLFLTSPCDVHLQDGLLAIELKSASEDIIRRSIEDVQTIVIDNHSVHISIPCLNRLSKNNILVIFCDENHMPTSMLLDFEGNCMQGKFYPKQISASPILKKHLWQQIIEHKICNQSIYLEKRGKNNMHLLQLSKDVRSGDRTNREGVAAKIYWKELMGPKWIRDRIGEAPNSLLNYGYAILRSHVTRALIGSGLLPMIGIFHHNMYDSFPLSDDIMEPYRPFIDEKVMQLYENGYTEIDKYVKRELIGIFYEKVTTDILSRTTHSLARCFVGEGKIIYYPIFE